VEDPKGGELILHHVAGLCGGNDQLGRGSAAFGSGWGSKFLVFGGFQPLFPFAMTPKLREI